MGSSMSIAETLFLWAGLCWRTLRFLVSLFQDAHEPSVSKAIGETETVFQIIQDTRGNIVHGEEVSDWGGRWYPSWAAKATADKTTLLRGYGIPYLEPIQLFTNIVQFGARARCRCIRWPRACSVLSFPDSPVPLFKDGAAYLSSAWW